MEFNATVYVVDDDEQIGQAIQWLLKTVKLPSRVFTSSEDFLNNYDPLWRGCILLDIRMPLLSGFNVQERLNQLNNQLPIILLTGHGDVPMAIKALKNGALDFLLKPFNDQVLLEKIHHALHINDLRAKKYEVEQIYAKRLESLTLREQEVFKLIAQGKLNKQIAAKLNIAVSTVELHRANLMNKMHISSVAELVAIYLLFNPSPLWS